MFAIQALRCVAKFLDRGILMDIGGRLRRAETSDLIEGEIKELTSQFHITLRANYARTQKFDGKPTADTLERLKELLDAKRSQSARWSEDYEAEQLLVDGYDDQTLNTELQVRSIEASRVLNPQLAAFYHAQIERAGIGEQRRSLLARLVNDLQWRYTVNEVKRRYSRDITSRTGWLFAWSLFVFGIGTAFIVLSEDFRTGLVASDLKLLVIAALAGTWGATFSMLGSLKGRLEASGLDDMKLMRPWVMLVSRALIGTGAGCVLYFLVRSGLLGGQAFPNIDNLGNAQEAPKNLALLIIWCFIAGFSEKLVPSILEKSAARVPSASTTDPGRYRPERPESVPTTPPPTGQPAATAQETNTSPRATSRD